MKCSLLTNHNRAASAFLSCKMQIRNPSLPFLEDFTAAQTPCLVRTGGWSRNLVVLKLNGHVVQSRSLPPNRKTGRAPPRFQQSQRSAVSTCAKTVSREKTQNVVDLFASCLFVVVMFRAAHHRVSLRSGHPERYTKAS